MTPPPRSAMRQELTFTLGPRADHPRVPTNALRRSPSRYPRPTHGQTFKYPAVQDAVPWARVLAGLERCPQNHAEPYSRSLTSGAKLDYGDCNQRLSPAT